MKKNKEKRKRLFGQKRRMSGGGHNIEWSRGENSHISMRKDDRVGGPKEAVS